ncbi:hypothetical protein ACL2XQ_25460 [Sodalis sp. RH14]|uniref:hypothetical protein n=1 Tax=Sodalis sp. RH14 TaxID=3394329 RepID=UPI0039B64F5A
MSKKLIYNLSGQRVAPHINTIDFFDKNYIEPNISAIDIFNQKKDLHIKLLGKPQDTDEWRLLANLIMLGFVSIVESYCRCVIRRMLSIDHQARIYSYKNTVTYAAALYHKKDILPEALLEDASFTSVSNIIDTFKKFTGLGLNRQQPLTLGSALDKYEDICQLRHCIVHKSGLFGTNNALKLGFDAHHDFLEKPIIISYDAIQAIASSCDNVVKELNDELFSLILHRSIKYYSWTGDFRTDRKFFAPYFNLFYSNQKNADVAKEQLKCFHGFCANYGFK